jgi:hypothetical protein
MRRLERFLSDPTRTLSVMSFFNKSKNREDKPTDPFIDPVAYLAALGIEAELVEVVPCLPGAA